MNVFIDIETIPTQPEDEARSLIAKSISAPKTMSKAETIEAWHNGEGKYAGEKDKAIETAYRKTSLSGTTGEIISIAWAVDDGEIFRFSRESSDSEHRLLYLFALELNKQLALRPAYFIGHNVRFDLRFLYQRAVINNGFKSLDLKQNGRHSNDFFCTMEAWAGFGQRISQDNLCKALGIEGKPEGIDGSKVWDYVKAGDIKKVEEYNADDVDKLRQIYNRIKSYS
jgi:predicted PolB exonuclease-like 3'-5' exonuclease